MVSSTAGLVRRIGSASSVALTAYVLNRGRLVRALDAAGDRGASVRVRLEGAPYGRDGPSRAASDAAIAELRLHGVDAEYAGGPPMHMKAAIVDGELFLDDRNWPDDGRDFVVKTRDAGDVAAVERAMAGTRSRGRHLQTAKWPATRLEAQLIANAAGGAIDCESESFGFSCIYGKLKERAGQGCRVRLLVAERDLRGGANSREVNALRRLSAAGVCVRVGPDDEKLCVAGGQAWLGSANATAGDAGQADWGMRTRVPGVVRALHGRFERNWARAHALA